MTGYQQPRYGTIILVFLLCFNLLRILATWTEDRVSLVDSEDDGVSKMEAAKAALEAKEKEKVLYSILFEDF